MEDKYISRHEYDACRSRCNDRCEQCQTGISMLKSELEHDRSEVQRSNHELSNQISDLKVSGAESRMKWAFMSFVGSFLAGLMTIVVAAWLISHYGIAQPQIDVTPKSDPITQKHPGYAYGSPIIKDQK